MKRIITIVMIILLMAPLFCDVKLQKVNTYKNETEGVLIRLEINAQDDITGNDIFFDEYGNLMLYQRDKKKIFFLDGTFQIGKSIDINTDTSLQIFQTVGNNILIGNHSDAFYINKDGIEFFRVNIYSLLNNFYGTKGNWFKDCYYDEKTNILFFTFSKTKTIPHSITSPSLDENQNQKNYRNADETRKLLESGEYAPHLKVDKDNDLYIEGIRYRWDATAYETKNYICTLNNKYKYVRVYDRKESELLYYTVPEKEEVESIAYHPNGDWYFLTINWTTNIHTLWRIENTWDPQWRKEWYENHETENVSQTVPSTNVAVNKEMTCSDNLRLRSEEATSSKVITTMQKGTKVKILKLGKAETIDGITSNWVQVEVLADAKDKDGKSIKAGTIGWCYGGYLEKK